jgi:hypothetical protein
MMTTKQPPGEKLEKQITTSKHWHVMPGMLDTYGRRVLEVNARKYQACESGWCIEWHQLDDFIPDTDDPATLACIEFLIRKVWDESEDRREALMLALLGAP